MEYLDEQQTSVGSAPGHILCCQCATPIPPNPTNMCVSCVKMQANIVDDISLNNTIEVCHKCERVFQPPNSWLKADLESKQLLGICLKNIKGLKKLRLVDASFIWTEPHSQRLNVKVTVEKEIEAGAVLRQSVVIHFVIKSHMCNDCHRVEAQDFWKAVVQVRQKTEHKKTFYYLEQLIIKYNQQSACTNVKPESGGVDFFYAREQDARKMVDFLQQVIPCRYTTAKKLKSHDPRNNTHNYKYTFYVEIVPVCRENIVALPKKLAQQLGNLSQLCICIQVSNLITLIDPFTLYLGEVQPVVYWREPFTAICPPSGLVKFMVIDVEPVYDFKTGSSTGGCMSRRHQLADVYISRLSEGGENQVHTRTHLGKILKPGDTVLGFDFRYSNINHPVLETMDPASLPDAIIVKKVYQNRSRRNRNRNWKLKKIADDTSSTNEDYIEFLEDIEEDPLLREKVNVYKDPRKLNNDPNAMDTAEIEVDEEDLPQISLDEMLEDFHLDEGTSS